MSVRVVFMGSPEFSLPALEMLSKKYEVVAVVTQPDRLAGRGKKLTEPPVKGLARSLGISVMQPERLRAPGGFESLKSLMPDLIVVVAYGQILRQNILDLPMFGCVNIHPSLLPRWRGAAPVQATILAGDYETGITIMKMDAGIDSGPIIAQKISKIYAEDTAGSLENRLAREGAELLLDVLPGYLNDRVRPVPQSSEGVTFAPMIKKQDALLDLSKGSEYLARMVRAYHPWPCAFMPWQDSILKIHKAHAKNTGDTLMGRRYIIGGLPAVGTSSGVLVLDEVQVAGKKPMTGEMFLHGARMWENI